MMPNNGPVIWQGDKAKLLNTGGIEQKNGVTLNSYLTLAAIKAAAPTGPEMAYVEEKEAVYLYCDSCAYDADDDLILTTGNGGDTRWELMQKISRNIGDTGWIDSDNATVSTVNATTTRLSISSQAAIGVKGIRIPVPTGDYDIEHSGAAGVKFVYFDDDSLVLKSRNSVWDFNSQVPVKIVYWSGTAIVAAPQTEFHGIRDNIWHLWAHNFLGLQYVSGLAFTGSVQTDNNVDPGASETVYNLWSTTGVVQDEDVRSTPGDGQWAQTLGSGLAAADAGVFPFFYFNGSFLTTNAAMADRAPFIHAGENTPPQWNDAGTLTASVTGDYVVYHYFANPMVEGWSVFGRPHNAKFTSLATALSARPSQLNWSNYAELKHIYTAIWRVNTNWSNSHQCKLVYLSDYRTVAGTPVAAIAPTNHAGLSGLELAGAGVTWGHVNDQAQTIAGDKTFSGVTTVTNATASTSTTTGALIVAGGIGVAGSVVTPFVGPPGSCVNLGAVTGIYRNCYVSTGARGNRTSATEIGGSIECQANSGNSSPCIVMHANKDNDSTTTSATQISAWYPTGYFIFGVAGTDSQRHTIYGSIAANDETLEISKHGMTQNTNNNFYMSFSVSKASSFDGFLQTNGSGVLSVVDASDIRWKENLRDLTGALAIVTSLKPKIFDWKSGVKNVKGFIAQEVRSILPESVTVRDDSEHGGFSDAHYLETQTMIPVLVAAIQEQQLQINELKAVIDQIKNL